MVNLKLNELIDESSVAKNGRGYRASDKVKASTYELSLYFRAQAKKIAVELEKLQIVKFVVLLGSVAQKKAQAYNDKDFLIHVANPAEKVKGRV
jgi:hypothetical protein